MYDKSFSRTAAVFLAGVGAAFCGACEQVDGTDLATATIKGAALRPNIINEASEIAPGIFHVPASDWPGWLVKFRKENPNVNITAISEAGEAQTIPTGNSNVVLTTGFVVVTDRNQQ